MMWIPFRTSLYLVAISYDTSVQGEYRKCGEADRELIADNEYGIGFATSTHPIVFFHLLENCLLQFRPVVAVPFGSHSPPHWVPIEDYAVFLIVAVIIKQHQIQGQH